MVLSHGGNLVEKMLQHIVRVCLYSYARDNLRQYAQHTRQQMTVSMCVQQPFRSARVHIFALNALIYAHTR